MASTIIVPADTGLTLEAELRETSGAVSMETVTLTESSDRPTEYTGSTSNYGDFHIIIRDTSDDSILQYGYARTVDGEEAILSGSKKDLGVIQSTIKTGVAYSMDVDTPTTVGSVEKAPVTFNLPS